MTVVERFLKLVSYPTTSDEASETCPSTARQRNKIAAAPMFLQGGENLAIFRHSRQNAPREPRQRLRA